MGETVRDFRTGSLKGLKAVVEDADQDRLFPKNRYICKDWLQKEYDLLWPRVWQWVCREEEIPEIGDFYEYRIGDQSFLIVREEAEFYLTASVLVFQNLQLICFSKFNSLSKLELL